ncbi:hypothetical protein [Paenibacillus sp. MMS20-IR301]|uniref:hypothetical protein n=1 Tax=Paenibacillus sp. MMS20-IR301 TaxID=2895946 RepID=UPI0028ED49BC|nr:hypothetical protein [Paenibacillus sp. MMS20-IR301]WNS43076.1 hypothetical protein LOS79_29710 [Paenibacillus sp. MMS20-IR301]
MYCVEVLDVLNRYELDSAVFGEDEYLIIDGIMNQDLKKHINKSNQADLVIIHRMVNYQIPVAISTKISYIRPKGKEEELFLICIPYKEHSDFIIMFDKHKSLFADNDYYLHYLANDLNMLDLIEKVMACSDDWWINPSVYKNLSEDKKKVFVDDLKFGTVDIFKLYDISIFDDLRIQLINKYKKCEGIPSELIELHEKRIHQLPLRDNDELRKEELNKKLMAPFLDFWRE